MGIAHISITSTLTQTIHETKRCFVRSVPAHNYSRNIPQPSKDFGSSPQGLVFLPGSLPLTTFVALPSYIPLHYCSPPLFIEIGGASLSDRRSLAWHCGIPVGFSFSTWRQFASLCSTHSSVIGRLAQICGVGPMESECAFYSMWKTALFYSNVAIGHEPVTCKAAYLFCRLGCIVLRLSNF